MSGGVLNSGVYDPDVIRPVMTNWANDIYITNDRDRPAVLYAYDQSHVHLMGTDAPQAFTPSVAAGGLQSTFPFTYYLRYRYTNNKIDGPGDAGYVSDPSPSGKVITGAGAIGQEVRWGVTASPDPKVTNIALEISYDGGTWQFIKYIANATATHGEAINAFTSGTALPWDERGHEPPNPEGRVMVLHKNVLFKFDYHVESGGTATLSTTADAIPALTPANNLRNWEHAMSGRYFKLNDSPHSAIVVGVETTDKQHLTLESGYGVVSANGGYTLSTRDPNVVRYSKTLLPESWNAGSQAFRVLVNTNDRPVAGQSYYDELVFFGEHAMEGMQFTTNPANATFYRIDDTRGAVNQECTLRVDSLLYAMDRHGIYVYGGKQPVHISDPIDEILEGRADGWAGIDWSDATNNFFAVYNADLREIYWFVTLNKTGESNDMNYALVYHVDEQSWTINRYAYNMRGGATLPNQDGITTPILSTIGSGLWELIDTSTDGIPEAAANVSGILAPDATATILSTSGVALYTTNDGLRGAAIVIDGVGSGIISANDSNTIWLKDALDSAPSAGTAFYLAPIEMRYKTRAVFSRDPSKKTTATYLEILHEPPTSTRQILKVKVKLDYSNSYTDFSTTGRELLDGVTVEDGALDTVVVDLRDAGGYHAAGYIRIPFPSVAFHIAEIELITTDSQNNLKINGLRLRMQGGEIIEI